MDHKTTAIIVFVFVYALIAMGRIPQAVIAILGAMLVIFLGVIPGEEALLHVDLEVILLLGGMMSLAAVIARTGIFDWAALKNAQLVRGSGFWLLCITAIMVAVASALLDNVTVVVLAVPITISLCRSLDLNPMPFLLTQVFASNIGGTATIVGDPPNIIVASAADIGFVTFIENAAPVAFISMVALIGIAYLWFRDEVTTSPEARESIMRRDPSETIKDRGLLIQSGVVSLLTMVGFLIHETLEVSPAFVAVAGAGVLVLISRTDPIEVLGHVEWPTLVFFTGLFILVGSLVETGVTTDIQEWMVVVTGDNERNLGFMILGVSGVASALVDNIPFTATMTPVISELAADGQQGLSPLWWSLVLGADLGGNATIVGASANVVVVGLARVNGVHISFVNFLKYGVVIAAASMLISLGYLWLRYYT